MRRILLFVSLLLSVSIYAQEGTKQFMPIGESEQNYLCLRPEADGYTDFAYYGCAESERLNIYLVAGEKMFFGMNFDNSDNTYPITDYKFTIRDPLGNAIDNGTVDFDDEFVPTSGDGFISTYDHASTGANGAIINGTTISTGYDPLSFTAALTGNYYIEFDVPTAFDERTSIPFLQTTSATSKKLTKLYKVNP